MPVIYNNRRQLAPEVEEECRAAYRSKEEVLREADFVVLAMPFTQENYHCHRRGGAPADEADGHAVQYCARRPDR
jgi:lactate dehydrogenase-like 2-hydroxyacid dehydrogenase